jgi:FG-GAP-like repeat
VRVLLGNGDGTFQPATDYPVGPRPLQVAVADFNKDGFLDLAVLEWNQYGDENGTVTILLGRGDGTFQAGQNYAAGTSSTSMAVGDLTATAFLTSR